MRDPEREPELVRCRATREKNSELWMRAVLNGPTLVESGTYDPLCALQTLCDMDWADMGYCHGVSAQGESCGGEKREAVERPGRVVGLAHGDSVGSCILILRDSIMLNLDEEQISFAVDPLSIEITVSILRAASTLFIPSAIAYASYQLRKAWPSDLDKFSCGDRPEEGEVDHHRAALQRAGSAQAGVLRIATKPILAGFEKQS
ncbi:hypothetical protein BKA93DRAFT_751380 [Sparassis latifolia]